MLAGVTTDDVTSRYEHTIPDSSLPWVWQRLSDAAALLIGQSPGIEARIANGATSATVVRIVLADAVMRVLRNPDGHLSESTGPYSRTLARSDVPGAIVFTGHELALVAGATGARTAPRTVRVAAPCGWSP